MRRAPDVPPTPPTSAGSSPWSSGLGPSQPGSQDGKEDPSPSRDTGRRWPRPHMEEDCPRDGGGDSQHMQPWGDPAKHIHAPPLHKDTRKGSWGRLEGWEGSTWSSREAAGSIHSYPCCHCHPTDPRGRSDPQARHPDLWIVLPVTLAGLISLITHPHSSV